MTRQSLTRLSAAVLAATLFATPGTSHAAGCAQPLSNGALPNATDCLYILQAAVFIRTCDPACECAPKGALPPSATDALICLKAATGQPVTLNCPPPCGTTTTTIPVSNEPPCSSAQFFAVGGSDLDSGWNGLGHNTDIVEGASITLRVVRRCSNDSAVCNVDADCTGGATCDLTCNCNIPGQTECEVFGPTDQARCLRSLLPCTTNANCASGESCQQFFGPPLPLSAKGTPACVTTYFQEPIVGTADSATGEGNASSFLRSRVHLGVAADKPCPRCGTVAQNPKVGQMFQCDGGPNNGQSCRVDAVSSEFGGVSFNCPPPSGSNVSGAGLAIIFDSVTTGTLTKDATLPCAFPLSGSHPSNGQATCLDDFTESCSTNADCLRCTNNYAKCTSNSDCGGGATCAAAPDQPIPCGIYCHCGYCNQDPDQPCFGDDDCDPGETCQAGTGNLLQQTQNNACANLLCGEKGEEECCTGSDCINFDLFGSTPLVGECSLATYRPCTSNSECATTGSGTCQFSTNPCFEERITRTGTPDPLRQACQNAPQTSCTTNGDCGANGPCVDLSEPLTVALFCIPPTTSETINSAGGIPGPGAIRFNSKIVVARCGDDIVMGDEQCDPPASQGGAANCQDNCRLAP